VKDVSLDGFGYKSDKVVRATMVNLISRLAGAVTRDWGRIGENCKLYGGGNALDTRNSHSIPLTRCDAAVGCDTLFRC
jgi:hypothetical protein